MSTAELSRPVEDVSASPEDEPLADIQLAGISDHTKLVINMLLLKGPVSLQTHFLYDAKQKGGHEEVSSVEELNDLIKRVSADKEKGKARIEILSRNLQDLAREVLGEHAE